ncbi:oxidoreductase [Paludibaculum fermentans]|uniref:SDR family NAD(P)-dependent oxidoreductase n=1 Tax=Paludibaculum fermentans TaxID=1473598 RepID=A0A7S7SL19_PALFE|nr:oxidoreductase [Paludibaculum fermentans]QOY88343.1 SDR family NAD(P)-dependent oxidoreductase [Paludibaculum fermentans]
MSNSKVWLITGSSRGLGRAFTEAVLAAGHRLVATARDPQQLAELVQQYGTNVRAVALDVTHSVMARSAVQTAVDEFGRLDVVVNNAGYGNVGAVEDVAEEDFRAQLETNFFGVVNVSRAALPQMRRQRSGHIVQISSIGGRSSSPGLAAYQSAKWAVGGFSEVLAKEVAPLGIKVTIVEPGGFRTDWAGSSMKVDAVREEYQPSVGQYAEFIRHYDGQQMGDPRKAAQVLLQLVELEEPPLRLLLGSDAQHLAAAIASSRAAEDEKWKELGAFSDFDGAPGIETLLSKLPASIKR